MLSVAFSLHHRLLVLPLRSQCTQCPIINFDENLRASVCTNMYWRCDDESRRWDEAGKIQLWIQYIIDCISDFKQSLHARITRCHYVRIHQFVSKIIYNYMHITCGNGWGKKWKVIWLFNGIEIEYHFVSRMQCARIYFCELVINIFIESLI